MIREREMEVSLHGVGVHPMKGNGIAIAQTAPTKVKRTGQRVQVNGGRTGMMAKAIPVPQMRPELYMPTRKARAFYGCHRARKLKPQMATSRKPTLVCKNHHLRHFRPYHHKSLSSQLQQQASCQHQCQQQQSVIVFLSKKSKVNKC